MEIKHCLFVNRQSKVKMNKNWVLLFNFENLFSGMELKLTQITRSLGGILATLTQFTDSQSGFPHECWFYVLIDGAVLFCWQNLLNK